MTDPFRKAKDADRDAALEVVDAAYAGGLITQADSELRVQRLQQARTMAEILTLTRDLPSPSAVSIAQPAPATDLTGSVREATPTARLQTRPEQAGRGLVGVLVAAVLFVVLAGVGVTGALFADEVTDSGVETGVADRRVLVDLTSARGFEGFVAEVADKTGSTVVFGATVYPGYAVVEVPVGEKGRRSYGWYYDGDWRKSTGRGTTEGERFDLADLDGRVVAATVRKAQRRVEDADSTYVLVNPSAREDDVCLSGYATRDDQTAYVDATCTGDVVLSYPR